MFAPHDKVVYPGHGVATIQRIIEKKIGSSTVQFFELRFLNKDMTILIPTENATAVGIRRLSSTEHIDGLFVLLAEPATELNCDMTASNWNKRNKEYQCKLRTGSLREICVIYRDLRHLSTYKKLSFGEKNLLQQTELLLIEEISLVTLIEHEKAAERLRSIFMSASLNLPSKHPVVAKL